LNPADVRVVYMGSPAFAVAPLRALAQAGYSIVGAVTQPDRPAGRGGRLTPPEARLAAQSLGVPVFQPESMRDAAALAKLEGWEPDVVVVAAFGKILPRAVLPTPTRGCINVHASLLPCWRGPSPVAAAILAGDVETGVSIMEMAPKMDAGPIIARERVAILPNDTTGTLQARLAEAGGRLLVATFPDWYDGAIVAQRQDENLATYCPLLKKEDGHLMARMTASDAERAVRAYDPWPGAFVLYRGDRLGIWNAHVEAAPGELPVGAMVVASKSPAVAFRDGLLVLDEVQRTGSRRQSGKDFVNGQRGALDSEVTLA